MRPYYEDELCTLYHADARKLAPELGVVDCVIADPPYGVTSFRWDRWQRGWPDWFQSDCLWSFGTLRSFTEHWAEFGSWKLAQEIIWEKQNGTGLIADRFKRVHELLVQFYQGKWQSLHRDTPREPRPSKRGGTIFRKTNPPHLGASRLSTYTFKPTRLVRSVLRFQNYQRQKLHPTTKPIGLIELIITYSVPPAGTVLDPFMGGGSTGVAAKRLGRRFIGIEIEKRWCRLAAERLAAEPLPSHLSPHTFP